MSLVVLDQLPVSYCRKNGGLTAGPDIHLKMSESFTRGFQTFYKKKNWKLFIVNTLDLYRQNMHEVQL